MGEDYRRRRLWVVKRLKALLSSDLDDRYLVWADRKKLKLSLAYLDSDIYKKHKEWEEF